jgi:hypothetical protein
MFILVHGRSDNYVILDMQETLADLRPRELSGDFVAETDDVTFAYTGPSSAPLVRAGVVRPLHEQPLFPWEVADESCYIRQLVRKGWQW